MSRFNEVYLELLRRYSRSHEGSMDGFSYRMNQLTNAGKSLEEAVLYLALELGIEIPEVEALVESGKSQEDAIRKTAIDLARARGSYGRS